MDAGTSSCLAKVDSTKNARVMIYGDVQGQAGRKLRRCEGIIRPRQRKPQGEFRSMAAEGEGTADDQRRSRFNRFYNGFILGRSAQGRPPQTKTAAPKGRRSKWCGQEDSNLHWLPN
jgi:hypothetical protein